MMSGAIKSMREEEIANAQKSENTGENPWPESLAYETTVSELFHRGALNISVRWAPSDRGVAT